MSANRQSNMASIKAKLDLEEQLKKQQAVQGSPLAPEDSQHQKQLIQNDLASTIEINRLKRAKNAATTKDVKDKLQVEIDDAILRRDEAQARRKAEAETIAASKKAADATQKVINDANAYVDGVKARGERVISGSASWLETKSIPGSIWLPITILILFFFLLLPVNGKTRFTWLFESIIGQAKIAGSGGTGGGAVSDFGEPSSNGAAPIRTFTGPGTQF